MTALHIWSHLAECGSQVFVERVCIGEGGATGGGSGSGGGGDYFTHAKDLSSQSCPPPDNSARRQMRLAVYGLDARREWVSAAAKKKKKRKKAKFWRPTRPCLHVEEYSPIIAGLWR